MVVGLLLIAMGVIACIISTLILCKDEDDEALVPGSFLVGLGMLMLVLGVAITFNSEDNIVQRDIYCIQCGDSVEENYTYCPDCGAKIVFPD